MDNDPQIPDIEVVLRLFGSDEIVLAVFEAERDSLDVVVGTSDQLLYQNFMEILLEVVTAGIHVTNWQSLPEPRSLPLPFEADTGNPHTARD